MKEPAFLSERFGLPNLPPEVLAAALSQNVSWEALDADAKVPRGVVRHLFYLMSPRERLEKAKLLVRQGVLERIPLPAVAEVDPLGWVADVMQWPAGVRAEMLSSVRGFRRAQGSVLRDAMLAADYLLERHARFSVARRQAVLGRGRDSLRIYRKSRDAALVEAAEEALNVWVRDHWRWLHQR